MHSVWLDHLGTMLNEKNKAMGFCISNNVASANYLLIKYKYKRIACVDFDVHWGNGNYDVMRNNKNSLYLSTHQYPFYPGGGTDKDKGNLIIHLICLCLLERTQKNTLMHLIEF